MAILLTPEALALLRCPRTQQPLHLASPDESLTWAPLDPKADDFLVTADGTLAYPVEDGYPILLLERALEPIS